MDNCCSIIKTKKHRFILSEILKEHAGSVQDTKAIILYSLRVYHRIMWGY